MTFSKTKVAIATTVCAATAFLVVRRKRRAARLAASQANAKPAASTIFNVLDAQSDVAIGDAVQYPPRIATIPVLLKQQQRAAFAGVESCFVVIDDLAAAPADLTQVLLSQGVEAFVKLYPKQCRFLSEVEGNQPFEPLAGAGDFTFAMTTAAFTALLLVDVEAGVVATLVAMGSNTTEAATLVAQSLSYTGPRDFDDAGFESADGTVSLPPCVSAAARDDVVPTKLRQNSEAYGVFQRFGAKVKVSRPDVDDPTPVHVAQYVNRDLGVQFLVPRTGVVYSGRLSPDSRLEYVEDVTNEQRSCRLTIQSVMLPSAWLKDNDLLIQGVILNCTEQLPDGSYPTRVAMHSLAGRRAAVFEQTCDDRWCKTFVCPTSREGAQSAGGESPALIVRWEAPLDDSAAQTSSLAKFLDTFFFFVG